MAVAITAEQLRLAKLLEAYGRLVDVERKKILLSYGRLKELGEEVERVADCLYDSEDALKDSVAGLALAHDRLAAALYGEPGEEEVEEEAVLTAEEEAVLADEEEVVEVDEIGADEEMVKIPISISLIER